MSIWGPRIFLSGQAVSLLGDGLAVLAVPLLVLELTSDPLAAALAAVPRSLGYLLGGLPAGVLADRHDPWTIMIVADVVRVAIFVSLFVLVSPPVGAILALAFAAGGAGVFFETALTVAVKDLFPAARLVRVNALLELVTQISRVAGPGAVGVLAAFSGVHLALLANALTFVVSLATLFAVRRPGVAPRRWARQSVCTQIRDGLRYLCTVRVVLTISALTIAVNLFLAVDTLIVFFARETLALSPALVGLIVVGGGVGGIAGAATAPLITAWLGQLRVITLGLVVTGLAVAAMSSATAAGPLLAVNTVMAWAVTVASVVNRSMRQSLIPRELLGRVTSTIRMAVLGVTPVGAVMAGALTTVLDGDPRPVFLGAGIAIATAAWIAWAMVLRRSIGDASPSY